MAMRSVGLYHKTAFRLCFLLALCLSLFSGCSRQAAGGENIFQTAIRFEDGIICPRDCDFAAPFDEVLKAKGLTEEAIDDAREDDRRIIQTISIDGLSDEIREICSFQNDRLVSITYNIPVSPDDFDAVKSLLQQQAEAYIPEEMLLTSGEFLETGTIWQDEKENAIRLITGSIHGSDDLMVSLSVNVAKTEEAMEQFMDD